jgi:hypothetical protein
LSGFGQAEPESAPGVLLERLDRLLNKLGGGVALVDIAAAGLVSGVQIGDVQSEQRPLDRGPVLSRSA